MEGMIESDSYYFKNILSCGIITQNCLQRFGGSKYVVGDDKGIVTQFQIKKNYQSENVWSSPGSQKGNCVSSIFSTKDRIFFSIGNFVFQVNKRGKHLTHIENNLDVKGCKVSLKTCYYFNDYFLYKQEFGSNEEKEIFYGNERIGDIFLSGNGKELFFSCFDKSIKKINCKENFEVVADEMKTIGVPNAVVIIGGKVIYYGTVKGEICMIDISTKASLLAGKKSEVLAVVENDRMINCIAVCDFNQNGVRNLCCGLNSGGIKIYTTTTSSSSGETGEKNLIFQKNINESITNVKLYNNKILCSSYSGKVYLLLGKSEANSNVKISLNQKQKLLSEIRDKENKLKDIKNKYRKVSKENIGTSKNYKIESKFYLVRNYYLFAIETNVQIDMLVVYSKIPMNVLEYKENFDITRSYAKNGTCYFLVKSLSDSDLGNMRFDMKVRTLEGKYGEFEIFVIPKINPKVSLKETKTICPLSLHERVDALGFELAEKKSSLLKIKGNFTLQQIHNWLLNCLNDLPLKLLEKEELTFCFKSNYQKTFLKILYTRGEATFWSDNISTISILEEYITKKATLKKIKINITFKINYASINLVIENLFPKLEEQFALTEKMRILGSLKELSVHERESIQNEKYKGILDNEKKLEEDFKQQKINLQFIYDILVRLIIDKCKFKRKNPKNDLDQLKILLASAKKKKKLDLKELLLIFK